MKISRAITTAIGQQSEGGRAKTGQTGCTSVGTLVVSLSTRSGPLPACFLCFCHSSSISGGTSSTRRGLLACCLAGTTRAGPEAGFGWDWVGESHVRMRLAQTKPPTRWDWLRGSADRRQNLEMHVGSSIAAPSTAGAKTPAEACATRESSRQVYPCK